MIEFREINRIERNIISNSLEYFNNNILEKIETDNIILMGIGNIKEIFLVSKQIYEIFLNIKKFKNPYYIGNYFGYLKNKKYFPSLNGLQIINNYTNKKVMINSKGCIKFIYGRDISEKYILKKYFNFRNNDILIVINNKNEVLGLGKIYYSKNNNLWIKNILDLGWYLRKGN